MIPDPSAHLCITSQNVLPFQNNSDATGDKFSSYKNNDSWLLLQDSYQNYTILPYMCCVIAKATAGLALSLETSPAEP